MPRIAQFINASLCIGGKFVEKTLFVDLDSGKIADGATGEVAETYDLGGHHVIAPAYLELQTNGCAGFHFTHFSGSENYEKQLRIVARHLASTGVGSFWATIPTVPSTVYQTVLPALAPRSFSTYNGAELLGAHCEGPYLNPTKKGAHDSHLMQVPSLGSPETIFGASTMGNIKMVTIAPELPGAMDLIYDLAWTRKIAVSLGHSNVGYAAGIFGLSCGARAITHVFNAMQPLLHRDPGLAGTIASPHAPFYSIIADGIHIHPSVVSMAYRAGPERCMLITDSIELAGLPDGVYAGHAQIPLQQVKTGNKVTILGTDTLVGSCIGLDECVRNLMKYARCSLPEAVRCVTENIANMMQLEDRGFLEAEKRADFTILDADGHVKEVWLRGKCVFNKGGQTPLSPEADTSL